MLTSGWDPCNGQHPPQVQRQGPLLQSCPLPLLCGHAQRKGTELPRQLFGYLAFIGSALVNSGTFH